MKKIERKRIILDTNVFLSALIFGGLPGKVLNFELTEHIVITTSLLLEEILEKMVNKFHAPKEILYAFYNLVEITEMIPVDPKTYTELKDQNDSYLLTLAETAKADILITGDTKHLLTLNPWKETQIISPRVFWKQHKVR